MKVILPELGEDIQKATVAFWHVKEGQKVQEGDDIVELVTDKASFNVPANKTGIIKRILAAEGKEVKIGQELAIIE